MILCSQSNLIRAAQPLGKGGPDNLFSVRDAKSHAQMRRTVANAYSISSISQYEPRIDDTLAAFFKVLEDEGSETNIGKWTHYCKSSLHVGQDRRRVLSNEQTCTMSKAT